MAAVERLPEGILGERRLFRVERDGAA